MDELGYEKMMHLYMIVTLDSGSSYKIEKNHIVEIKQSTDIGQDHVMVPGARGTVKGMFILAEKKEGVDKLFKYHLVTQNCQKFVLWMLGEMCTPAIRSYVEQDVGAALKGMGLLAKVATAITDAAGVTDVLLNGKGNQ